MNYVDIAVLAIIVLFIIVGFFRGFLGTLISFAGAILALGAAFFLSKSLASIIGGIGGLREALGNLVGGMLKGEVFNTTIDVSSEASVAAGLELLKLPPFLAKLLAPAVVATVPAGAGTSVSLGSFLGPVIVDLILVIISFILIYVVARLIVRVIEKFIKTILMNKTLRAGDRVLGGVFGLVKAYFVLCLLLIVLELLIPAIPALSQVRGMIEQSNLAKSIIDNNIIKRLLENFNLGEVAKGLMPK